MLTDSVLSPYEEDVLSQLFHKQNQAFVQRDRILAEQAEYLQFADALAKVQNQLESGESSLKVMMDIGCNFYTEAVVDNTNCVIVNLGKGIYAELSLAEAKRFVSRKINVLKAIESMLSDDIASAKAAYKMILGLKVAATTS